MLDRGILKPVLPEIEPGGGQRLATLIAAERAARIAPDGLRRLAALLPRDPALAEAVAARLQLSNKAKKRLGCAAAHRPACVAAGAGLSVGTSTARSTGCCSPANRGEAAQVHGWAVRRACRSAAARLIARGLDRRARLSPGPCAASRSAGSSGLSRAASSVRGTGRRARSSGRDSALALAGSCQ